jgi:hypothetical protein
MTPINLANYKIINDLQRYDYNQPSKNRSTISGLRVGFISPQQICKRHSVTQRDEGMGEGIGECAPAGLVAAAVASGVADALAAATCWRGGNPSEQGQVAFGLGLG